MLPRVLIVAPQLDIGGTEMHLTRIIPRLRQSGLDVSLFLLRRGGRLDEDMTKEGVPLLGPPAANKGFARSLLAAFALRREVQRLRPDIVHFFLPEAYLVGSLALVALRGPIRIMSRRSLAHYQRDHPILALVERRLHRFTGVLLGNSTAVVTELVQECGDSRKIGLIHNGTELPPMVSPQRRQALLARPSRQLSLRHRHRRLHRAGHGHGPSGEGRGSEPSRSRREMAMNFAAD